MITLTSARPSARTVELASGKDRVNINMYLKNYQHIENSLRICPCFLTDKNQILIIRQHQASELGFFHVRAIILLHDNSACILKVTKADVYKYSKQQKSNSQQNIEIRFSIKEPALVILVFV